MIQTSFIKRKIEEYKKHCILALDLFFKKDFEHSATDFRKSGEAFMKILILEKFGDNDGHKIIIGEIDTQLNSIVSPKELDYQELYDIIYSNRLLSLNDYNRLKDIQIKGNHTSHNPNNQHDRYKEDAELCKAQSYQLSDLLFLKLNCDIPIELKNAYSGEIDHVLVSTLRSSNWFDFFHYTDMFSSQNKYILVAPPKFKNCSEFQLQILSRINWSFVIDFDPTTKISGVYKAFEPIIKEGYVPITIRQRGQKGIVSTGTYGSVNWLFANGLKSIPDTICENIKDWRKSKYHQFIKELFSDFFSKSVSPYVIIYMWDDMRYIEEIVRAISDIDEISSELIKHIFLTESQEIIDTLEEFDKYDIQFKSYKITISEFIGELSSSLSPQNWADNAILVPARTKKEEQTIIDIGDIYHKLLSNGLSVVHQNIDQIGNQIETEEIPSFYQGEQIAWKELSIDIDVRRSKYNDLLEKIKSYLSSSKKSLKYELLHNPGAGGTTLSRRIAYDLRKEYPVVAINNFDKTTTYRELSLLIDNVNKPILATVEASNIGVNDIEDLIRLCNAAKQIVIFIYVKRSIKIGRDGELITYINDKMVDVNEQEKFINKVSLYSKDKISFKLFSKLKPSECEVIDFSMAIADENYNKERLVEYIKSYINQMPEEHVQFTAYASIIYHYSQKSVSEHIFRSLFKKSLSHELRQTAFSNQFIRRILIQEIDSTNIGYTEYWRPRFSKFAEAVLFVVVGDGKSDNWKEKIPLYAMEIINIIKLNNEYLVDETRQLLKSVFLERNNEDLLGKEEQWQSQVSNEQFSDLLKDISDTQTQKSILITLAETFPSESHFWGHLARFIYEKAEDKSEFIEAEKYIKIAFENGGDMDFNLQHIGGMCKRRQIEFYKRNYHKENKAIEITDSFLQELVNEANEYFYNSQRINPYNIHAYIAQIQTLITAIDFGKELSGTERKEYFITNPKNNWYLQQYDKISSLVEEAKVLIEIQETLGVSNKTVKAKSYLHTSEGKLYGLLGDYSTSIELFKNLIDSSERIYRPHLRLMYVNSTLLSKVRGNYRKINDAWRLLNDKEINSIEKALNDNILQDQNNIQTLRIWLRYVRYSYIDVSIEEIISRLKIWYENSEENFVLRLEAAYYLYVYNACHAIKAGESFSKTNINEANKFIAICKNMSQNDKFPFEWLGKDEGVDCLINHRNRDKDNDNQDLERVNGTISIISSRQQGQITLNSGLKAFFVPNYGNFIQGKDETIEVSFYVGFRHDGLFALDVKRIEDINKVGVIKDQSVIEEIERVEKIEEIEEIKEVKEDVDDERITTISKIIKISGPKVVGQIDLSKFEKYKRKK